jgi:thiamine pyrophosphate-dependent acetolactate synthase large subunit-like protein
VSPIFGLMGDSNMLYVSAYIEGGGRFVPAAHEAGAVSMAYTWSRAVGRIGVATVTQGPGFTNTVTALVEAVHSHDHLLLMTATTPPEPTHPQRIELEAVVTASGAGYERVYRPETLVRDLNRALQRIVAENRPVVLDLPIDFVTRDVEIEDSAPRMPVRRDPFPVTEAQLDAPLGLIASARRPIVLAGRGAVASGAEQSLTELADVLAAPVMTTVLAKDMFAGHPANLGICGSLASGPGSRALADADCIIAFGASLNLHTSMHREITSGKKVVQIDHDPGRFGWYVQPDEAVLGDVGAVAAAMVESLRDSGHEPNRGWLDSARRLVAEFDPRAEFPDRSNGETVDIRTASIQLDELLPARRNLVTDVGRFMFAPWKYLRAADPTRFAAMSGFNALGLGLAGAVGMALAHPDMPTVVALGDGGFMMNPAELATAVRERLPLVVLLFNDGCYGAEYHKFDLAGIDPAHSYVSWPDLAQLAQGFGADGLTVTKLSDLDVVASLVERLERPLVLDIRLDPAVDIFP